MSMTEALGAESAGAILVWRGEEYRVSPITMRMEADYSEWLRARAVAMAKARKSDGDPDEYAELMAAHDERAAAGKYEFWGNLSRKSWSSQAGAVRLFWLLLRPHHPQFKERDVAAMLAEEPEATGAILCRFFALRMLELKMPPGDAQKLVTKAEELEREMAAKDAT